MKTLATIALSLVAIVASLFLVLFSICAVNGDIGGPGHQRGLYSLWAMFFLGIVVLAMLAIGKLNRRPPTD